MKTPPRLEKQYFFDDTFVDVFLNVVAELTTELGIVKERLDTVERVLDENGVSMRDLIEQYQPDQDALIERTQARMKLVQTILDPFREHFSTMSDKSD